MANDPNTIQYVIQEDGFWYVASKDRTPGVPEITVSAKGVANGLSTEYNDGYDFGPDSYNPSVTTGVPLTQTSGIQEAVTYNLSNGGGTIIIKNGLYTVSVPIKWSDEKYTIQIIGENAIGTSIPSNEIYPAVTITPDSSFPTSSYIFEINTDEAVGDQQSFSIMNLIINCSPNNGTTTGIAGAISIVDAYHVKISDCLIAYSSTNGILFSVTNGTVGDTFHIENCMFFINNGYDINSSCPLSYFINNHHFKSGNSSSLTASGAYYLSQASTTNINGAILDTVSGAGIVTNLSGGDLIIDNLYSYGYVSGPVVYGSVEALLISNSELDSAYSFNVNVGSNVLGITNCKVENGATSTTGLTYYIFNSKYPSYTAISNCVFTPNVNSLTPSDNYIQLTGSTEAIVQTKNIIGLPSPTLSTNPPTSAKVYQNTNPYNIEIDLPVYASTSGTAGYVTVAKGASSSSLTTIGNQYVSGDTSDTSEQIIRLRVPAGWYYEFTASGVTFGTASVFAD